MTSQAVVAPPTVKLCLGTRGSSLAVLQSTLVADALRALGADVELVTIRTAGDDRPPDTAWGEGAFVGALEAALLNGTIDLAVHSAKDVPTTEPEGLVIAAYPAREDPRDAIVGRAPGQSLAALPHGARVGTDSPRRSVFLRAVRPDLDVHPLHGNVDSRLRRLDDGATDALVLAVAGLVRIGRPERIGEILPLEIATPAPGQGALAIQCRTADTRTREWIDKLDDPATRASVEAERALLQASGGGCRAPIGAAASVRDGNLVLRAASAGMEAPLVPPGERPIIARGEISGPVDQRHELAHALAARLAADLRALHGPAVTLRPRSARRTRRVLVTRPAEQSDELVGGLAALGVAPIAIPTIQLVPAAPGGELDRSLATVDERAWVVVTSANGARSALAAFDRVAVHPGTPRWAAIGTATARVLRARAIEPGFIPEAADAATLARALPIAAGTRVILPRSDIADPRIDVALSKRGAIVEAPVAYATIEGPDASRAPLRTAFAAGPIDAITFTSGSTVRGLVASLTPAHRRRALAAIAVCSGASAIAEARAAGFERIVASASPATSDVVARVAEVLAAPATKEDPS